MVEAVLLENIKTWLGIAGEEKNSELKLCLEEAKEIILNYCNIKEIPGGLKNTLVRMAAEIYRNEQPGDSVLPQAVKSISEGDTSTSFSSAQEKEYTRSILKNYRSQLNRYRRVGFR